MNTEELFRLMQTINQEGLDNSEWNMDELYNTDSSTHYGTIKQVPLEGKYIAVWAPDDYTLAYVDFEDADHRLELKEGGMVYLWKV